MTHGVCRDTGTLRGQPPAQGCVGSHITWRTQSPWLGRTLPRGHGHRAEQWHSVRATWNHEGPQPVPVCPNVPLSPSQPSPIPFISHFSLCLDSSLWFLHSSWLSPLCPFLSLTMTFLGLPAHVLVPLGCNDAQGWAGDVSLALLFPLLAGKMDWRSPSHALW